MFTLLSYRTKDNLQNMLKYIQILESFLYNRDKLIKKFPDNNFFKDNYKQTKISLGFGSRVWAHIQTQNQNSTHFGIEINKHLKFLTPKSFLGLLYPN